MTTPTTFAGLVAFFLGLINQIIPLLMGFAFVYLMWKLIDVWVIHADDANKVEEGRTIVMTGVIAFVVMVSIWGILSLLRHSIL
jgi:uncharacterized membrane protein